MCLDSSRASLQVPVCEGTRFVGSCSSGLDVVPPVEVLCRIYSEVLCTGNYCKSSEVEGVAGGDPVPFLGKSQLVTYLYIKGHKQFSFPGLWCPDVILWLGGVGWGPNSRVEHSFISKEACSGFDSIT